jgi:regulator of replication initiation timing
MESSLERMLMEFQIIKKAMHQRFKEKVNLSLENQKLKERLFELENMANNGELEDFKIEVKSSLNALYNDGFHVCNTFYGNRFLNDEECLLCLEMLDR